MVRQRGYGFCRYWPLRWGSSCGSAWQWEPGDPQSLGLEVYCQTRKLSQQKSAAAGGERGCLSPLWRDQTEARQGDRTRSQHTGAQCRAPGPARADVLSREPEAEAHLCGLGQCGWDGDRLGLCGEAQGLAVRATCWQRLIDRLTQFPLSSLFIFTWTPF